jgi:DNA polymerase III gamma/tau subunit
LEDHIHLLHSSTAARFRYLEALAKDKGSSRQALMIWLSYWRDVLLRSAGADVPLTNLDRTAEISELAQKIDLKTAHQAVKEIEKTLSLLESNTNTRLALEVLWLNLPRIH